MNRPLALLFSIIGILLLTGVSYSIAAGLPWLALLFALAAIGFIGFGFVVKAKLRKADNPPR